LTADEMWQQMTQETTGIPTHAWHTEIILAGVKPVSLHGDTLTLRAGDARNLEMLEGRLRMPLQRAASAIARREIRVAFTLNGHGPKEEAQPAPELQPAQPQLAEPESATETSVIEAATNHILAGFSKHSHYLTRFVRAYLGAAAFDTWDFIRSHCKDSSLVWTPAKDFAGIELARGAATPYQRIVGVWRNCGEFDRALFETGEMIPCCRQYAGEMTTTKPTDQFPQGRPTCRHWVPGALEVLEAEGLAVYQKHGDTPRNTFFAIQVYQHPPLLTPLQASRFVSKFQIEHREFVRGLLKSQEIGLAAWTAITAFSFLPLLPEVVRLTGLEMPLPEVGVFSALARNHIFFESATCAKEGKSIMDTPDCTQESPATVQPVGLYSRTHRIRGHKK
jgi:hypothetical protein